MIDESNPAGRLHSILSKARHQKDDQTVRAVWSKVFGIEENDVEVTKSVMELYLLSQEIQSLIQMNKKANHDLYLSSFNRIDYAIFPLNLASKWQNSKKHLTDESLTRLQFCAEFLSEYYSEEALSKEDLNDIIKKTNELYDALYTSTLSDELRVMLLEEVQRIRNAVSMYQIRGAKGLKEALQGTIGAVVANQEELKDAKGENENVIKRIGILIDKIDVVSSKALKIQKIISSFSSFNLPL